MPYQNKFLSTFGENKTFFIVSVFEFSNANSTLERIYFFLKVTKYEMNHSFILNIFLLISNHIIMHINRCKYFQSIQGGNQKLKNLISFKLDQKYKKSFDTSLWLKKRALK